MKRFAPLLPSVRAAAAGAAACVVVLLAGLAAVSGEEPVLGAAWDSFWLTKEVRVRGLRMVPEERLRAALPNDRSFLWWHMNEPLVRAAVSHEPFVASAAVSRCRDVWSIRCFEVDVTEREAAYVSVVDGAPWLIARDGGFVSPLPRKLSGPDELDQFLRGRGTGLTLLEGVTDDGVSPDTARGRLLYLASAVEAMKSEVDLDPVRVTLLRDGEMRVVFREPPVTARFSFTGDDKSRIAEEARRLGALVRRFGERVALVREIDLAFGKSAVVTLKADPTPAPPPKRATPARARPAAIDRKRPRPYVPDAAASRSRTPPPPRGPVISGSGTGRPGAAGAGAAGAGVTGAGASGNRAARPRGRTGEGRSPAPAAVRASRAPSAPGATRAGGTRVDGSRVEKARRDKARSDGTGSNGTASNGTASNGARSGGLRLEGGRARAPGSGRVRDAEP